MAINKIILLDRGCKQEPQLDLNHSLSTKQQYCVSYGVKHLLILHVHLSYVDARMFRTSLVKIPTAVCFTTWEYWCFIPSFDRYIQSFHENKSFWDFHCVSHYVLQMHLVAIFEKLEKHRWNHASYQVLSNSIQLLMRSYFKICSSMQIFSANLRDTGMMQT